MPAQPQQSHQRHNLRGVLLPEAYRRAVTHHPLPIAGVQVDRRVKRGGPLLHGGVVMRVRNRDRADAPRASTNALVAGSRLAMQSHRTLPCGVRSRSARWLMAKAGTVLMLNSCGSSCCHLLVCVVVRLSKSVHARPSPGHTGAHRRKSGSFGLFIVSGTAGFTECNHRLSSAIKH